MASKNKTKYLVATKLCISAGILAYLFRKIDVGQVYDEIQNIDIPIYALSLIVMGLVGVVAVKRWLLLLNAQDIKLGNMEAFRIHYIGMFFDRFFPGLTGGDLIKSYYAAKKSNKKTTSVVVVFLDRILAIVALALLSGIAVVLYIDKERYFQASIIIYCFLACTAVGALIFFSRRIRGFVRFDRLFRLLPFKAIVKEAGEAVFLYRSKKRCLAKTFLTGMIGHCVVIVANYGYAKALGVENVSLIEFCALVPVCFIISCIPISFGGWGVGEACYIYFLQAAGLDASQALTVSILNKVGYLFWSMPGAYFFASGSGNVSQEEMQAELADAG